MTKIDDSCPVCELPHAGECERWPDVEDIAQRIREEETGK